MRAILIPANSSDPVRKIDFDPDKSWRYVVTRYDPGLPWLATEVAFLTKENAPRDYSMRNSRAIEFVRNEFDAANDQTYGLGSPEDLYGDVVVLGYDKAAFEKLTDVPAHADTQDIEDPVTRTVTVDPHHLDATNPRDNPDPTHPWDNLDQDPEPDRPFERVTDVPQHGESEPKVGLNVGFTVGARGRTLSPEEERMVDAHLARLKRAEQDRNRDRDIDLSSRGRDIYQRGEGLWEIDF
jgi:hypothetical protein